MGIFLVLLAMAAAQAGPAAAAVDPATLPQVSYHPAGPFYWERPYFANAVTSGFWIDQTWTPVPIWNDPQFDAHGYPQFLQPGQVLRAVVSGLNSGYNGGPPSWPDVQAIFRGHLVLTWRGNADLRLLGPAGACTYLASESSGPATGLLTDGRRVYRCTQPVAAVDVIALASPLTDLELWLPDPADPQNASLEGQLFHPSFLGHVNEKPWGYIRFMDWAATNASPVQDWTDRRRPGHAFGMGVLNPRPPAAGFTGNRQTGLPYEVMVTLANATQKDLWITVPHLATDDFVTKLAQLLRFGSDGANPYTAPQANPVWPPLAPERRVFVEYSNEIWSALFEQGAWAEQQAQALGISRARFNGRRFADVFRHFQAVFGGTDRLVRVAAVFTGLRFYTEPFLNELRDYGQTLSPPVEPDVIAGTTYFGNGIQDWVHAQAQARAGTDDPWFYTGEVFDPGNGQPRPVSVPADHPYWSSADFARHRSETFAEWARRTLGGSSAQGGGPDATGFGGGFDIWLRELAQATFPSGPKPLVSYEGGPSLYTDYLDGADPRDDGVTLFVAAMNRDQGLRRVYETNLNMAKSKGLRTHGAFVDASGYGRFGQFGHMEHWLQPPAQAPKWQLMLDWVDEMAAVRHIDDPAGAVPTFVTAPRLAVGGFGQPYAADIGSAGGDGGRTARVVDAVLPPGLAVTANTPAAGDVRVSGTPRAGGTYYVYVRVTDADSDPAWRIFTFYVAGGPGTLVEADLRGTAPGLNTPWMPTYVTAPTVGSYSGLVRGPGAFGGAADDALGFSVFVDSQGTTSTLANAVQDGEYVGFTLQAVGGQSLDLRRGALRFTVARASSFAPRRYAVFTSAAGFAAGQEVFVTPEITGMNEPLDFVASFPDDPAYEGLSGPVEVRIYGFAAQWGGHQTRLTALRLSSPAPPPPATEMSIDDVVVDEGAGQALFTVSLSAPATEPATVAFATADGSALAGSDYTAASGTLTFAPGELTQVVAVPVLDDAADETDEAFAVVLSNAAGAILVDGQGQAVIADDDTADTLQFQAGAFSLGEGGRNVVVTVTRAGTLAGTVSVDYATADGSAVAGSDYAAALGTLTFGPGVAVRRFQVTVASDTLDEGDETVALVLDNPTGGAVLGATATAVLTIVDDDVAGVVEFRSARFLVVEGQPHATLTVERTAGAASGVTVAYSTGDLSALAGQDYTAAAGTLAFGAGQSRLSFTVPVTDDAVAEGGELAALTLSAPTGGAVLGGRATSLLAIDDNEATPTVFFESLGYEVGEAGLAARIVVRRLGATAAVARVNYTLTAGSATAGQDYAAVTGTLRFSPGSVTRVFTIPILDDGAAEEDETVALTLDTPVDAVLGTQAAALLTIHDDDTLALGNVTPKCCKQPGLQARDPEGRR
jgi:hypothetical protein